MKLTIRFLINTLDGGGAEKVLINLLNQLDPQEYDLHVVSVKGGTHASAIPDYVSYRRIVRCKNRSMNSFCSKVVQKLPPKVFAALFLRGRYDVEVAYLEGITTRFVAAKKTKAAKIAFVHCDVSVNNRIQPLYPGNTACLDEYRSFSKVCFVSKQGMAGFEKTYGSLENGCVVHNVIDVDTIRQKADQSIDDRYSTDGVKIVTVGRLSASKGYPRLLKVVAELEKTYDFELWILGEGEERPLLEQMIAENGIRSVKLKGFHSNPYPYVKQADLFVCSSYSEGYSTAVTEAILLGVPVLTTDCAGMDEILCDGAYGMIVDNSEQGLRDGLSSLLEKPDCLSVLKKAAKDRSELLLSDVSEYNELFHELMKEK